MRKLYLDPVELSALINVEEQSLRDGAPIGPIFIGITQD